MNTNATRMVGRQNTTGRRGVALLSALAILAVFAVITATFLFSLTLQERASISFQDTAAAQEGSESGALAVLAALELEFNGPDGIPYSGDERYTFDSLLSPAMAGRGDMLQEDQVYDARSWQPLIFDPQSIEPGFDPFALLDPKYYMPVGVDEDPPGDLSALIEPAAGMSLDAVLLRAAAPGIPFFDDDGDGLVDEDGAGNEKWLSYDPLSRQEPVRNPLYDPLFDADDDEDGRIDEDPGLRWDAALGWIRDVDPLNEYAGMVSDNYMLDDDRDISGVFDMQARLNINVGGAYYAGVTGGRYHEGASSHELDPAMLFLALDIPVADALQLVDSFTSLRQGDDSAPGLAGVDDDKNNAPLIGFNGLDDDNDGQIDEEDEIYIGAMARINRGDVRADIRSRFESDYIPGDGIDNDGDGRTDEADEGVDNPQEFDPLDDLWYDAVRNLRLAQGFRPNDPNLVPHDDYPVTISDNDTLQMVEPLLTVVSHGPQVSPMVRSTIDGLAPRINLNRMNNYSSIYGGEDLSYLLSLQVDNDRDWSPRYDLDGNNLPSGDADGEQGESAATPVPVGTPHNRNGRDDDGDLIADDDGDFTRCFDRTYDPEWGVNEDPWGDVTINEINGAGYGVPGYRGVDDDRDGLADFEDLEVRQAIAANPFYIPGNDDDEDGRSDEDPPEFLALLNLAASINQPRYFIHSGSPAGMETRDHHELRNSAPLLPGVDMRNPDPGGIYDPDARNTFYGVNQRAFSKPPRGHPVLDPLDSDPAYNPSGDFDPEEAKQVEKNLLNFAAAQAIRINEVMALPVVRLNAEDGEFQLVAGYDENGVGLGRDEVEYRDAVNPETNIYRANGIFDSHWEETSQWAFGIFDPDINPFRPVAFASRSENPVRIDNEYPSAAEISDVTNVYFQVRNNTAPTYTLPGPPPQTLPRQRLDEHAVWTFSGVPQGDYLGVYVAGRSEHIAQDLSNAALIVNGQNIRFSPTRKSGPNVLLRDPITVGVDGRVEVEIILDGETFNGDFSFDRLDLYNLNAQYVELINVGSQPANLNGWRLTIAEEWEAPSDPGNQSVLIGSDLIIPPDDPATPEAENVVLLVPAPEPVQIDGDNFEQTYASLLDAHETAGAANPPNRSRQIFEQRLTPGNDPMRMVTLDRDRLVLRAATRNRAPRFRLQLRMPERDRALNIANNNPIGLGEVVDEAVVELTLDGLAPLGFVAQERFDPMATRVVSVITNDKDVNTGAPLANQYRTVTRQESVWAGALAADVPLAGNETFRRVGNPDATSSSWGVKWIAARDNGVSNLPADMAQLRNNPNDFTALFAIDDFDLPPLPGMAVADRDLSAEGSTEFVWEGSAERFPPGVYRVRLFGTPSHRNPRFDVGRFGERNLTSGASLAFHPFADYSIDGLRPLIDTASSSSPLTRAAFQSGTVAFVWDNRNQNQDLRVTLSNIGLTTSDVEFVFDRVELSSLGGSPDRAEDWPYLGGTPGRHNLNQIKTADNMTALELLRLYPVRAGRLPSAGYLLQALNDNHVAGIELADSDESNDIPLNVLRDLFRMATAHPDSTAPVRGQININTAPFEVLVTLPFAPVRYQVGGQTPFEPTDRYSGLGVNQRELIPVMAPPEQRFAFNSIVANMIIQGREKRGLDGQYGRTGNPSDYRAHGSDDGPYADPADLLPVLTSSRMADALLTAHSLNLLDLGQFWPEIINNSARYPGDAERRLAIRREMQLVFARVVNLVTTRSGVMSVIARGRRQESPLEASRLLNDRIRAERVIEIQIDRSVR